MSEPTVVDIRGLEECTGEDYCQLEREMPVPELIDQILNKHHKFLRCMLRNMKETVSEIREKYNNEDDSLNIILFYFDQLAIEQFNHMDKEELLLFPYIKSLYEDDNKDPLQKVHFANLKSPLSIMEMEHDNTIVELKYMRTLADDYKAPSGACNMIKSFYDDLEIMERDILLHLYKENNILHPKAIAREEELYGLGY